MNQSKPKLIMISRPAKLRAGYSVATSFLAFSWAWVVAWYIGAYFIATFSSALLAVVLVCDTAFAAYLVVSTASFIRKNYSQYLIEVNDKCIFLYTFDRLTKKNYTRRICLADLAYAEHFGPVNGSTLSLTSDREEVLELPLWAMPDDGRLLLDYLRERKIPIESTNVG